MTVEVTQVANSDVKSSSKKSKKNKERKPEGDVPIGDNEMEKPIKEKKEKKDKKKKSKDNEVDKAEVSVDNGEKKNDKKKKDKKKSAPAEGSNSAEGGDSMQVDEPEPSVSKKEKKDKKRKREAEAEAEQEGPAEGSEKKKKKRKSEASPVYPPPTPESDSSSKKDKKKKSHTELAATSASTSSAVQPTSDDVTAFLTKHSITINSDTPLIPIISFSQLQVPDTLRSAYQGFKEPTPIQACTWPPTLEGRDVVGIAETGSGKTLAFGLPALAQIASTSYTHTKPVVLIVAPTRELAIQTHDTLVPLSKPFGIQSVAIFGGVDKAGQVKALQSSKKSSKGPTTRIVVGTPGRILDLIQDGILDLSEVHYLVLDEADRMLDKGFENDIRNIISRTKQGQGERQTLMFSATWPEAVRKLAGSFLRNPVRVTVGSDDLTANSRVEQILEVFDNNREKDSRLLGHLSKLMPRKGKAGASVDDPRILVFALYKKEAARLESTLRSRGYSVGGLHGDMAQRAREEALGKFKSGETPLLVATDVAARGLDIPNVAVVLNYTFPLTIEDYIHRIGRTGRGGKSGKSITFFTGDAHERSLAGELAKVLRESGFESEDLKNKFPMTIKKKTHSAYGAFFRDDIPTPTGPTKITFD